VTGVQTCALPIWLRSKAANGAGKKARRDYVLTGKGIEMLERLRRQVEELHREVAVPARRRKA
jgi:DNA-binding PadR family transcriptional regulator